MKIPEAFEAYAQGEVIWVEWVEPRPGINQEGKVAPADVLLRTTVGDCIKMQRAANMFKWGKDGLGIPPPSDQRCLEDFVACHYAKLIKPEVV